MKRLFLLLLLLSCLAQYGVAGAADDPLQRRVTLEFDYTNFDEAVAQIGQKTGMKVSCPKEISEFLDTVFMKQSMSGGGLGPKKEPTVKTFLDLICDSIGVAWSHDRAANTVMLGLPWKINDPRTAAELLVQVRDHEGDVNWQAAFNALLSKDGNYEKAWRVRQKSIYQNVLRGLSPEKLDRFFVKPMVATSLERYTFVLIRHPIQMYPGRGAASYYWFKEDGTLAGAGLMNTGHRCALIDMAIDHEFANSDKVSELQMVLKMNERDYYLAFFALGPDGLNLTRFTDIHGEVQANDGLHVGESLLAPDKQ